MKLTEETVLVGGKRGRKQSISTGQRLSENFLQFSLEYPRVLRSLLWLLLVLLARVSGCLFSAVSPQGHMVVWAGE